MGTQAQVPPQRQDVRGIDVSVSTYADDVQRTYIVQSALHAHQASHDSFDEFGRAMLTGNFHPQGKEPVHAAVSGRRERRVYESMLQSTKRYGWAGEICVAVSWPRD